MIQKITSITEKALLYHLQCPIRSDGSTSGPESPVLNCAESTARWLIEEIAAGRQPTAGETREYFDTEWQQTAFFQSRDAIPLRKYDRMFMEGLRACRRLRDLIWRCEILQPVCRYELPVDGVVITGEYAVLRSSRRKSHAFVPYLRYKGLKIRPVIPEIVTFARWVAANRAPAREWRINRMVVMHYWINQDLAAEYQPNPDFAGQVLRGVAGMISLPRYPRTGEHCLTCPKRNCTAATHHERVA